MPAALIGPVEGVAVLGGGTAFPPRELSNEDVLRALPDSGRRRIADEGEIRFLADGLEKSLGVRRRAWAHLVGTPLDHAHEPTTLDLTIEAARAALSDAGVAAAELALVICATSTPHRMTSTLAAPVGSALGARCACVDTRTGCAAGIFALATGALFQAAGAGPVLVTAAETFSKIVPPRSRLAAASLADGAAALVLGSRPGCALEAASMESDGSLARLITTDGALPPTSAEIERGGYLLTGAPDDLTREVPAKYEAAIGNALARAGRGVEAIDLYVPHQTSKDVIEAVRGRIGMARERTFVNLHRHANIGSAGWMAAFVEARAEGRVPPGARVLVAAVGGGMSWGAAVLRC